MAANKKYYTRKEAINMLGIHNNTIRKLRINNEISTIKIGKTRHLYDVVKFINENKNNTLYSIKEI